MASRPGQLRLVVRECGITAARVGVARYHRHHRPSVSGLVAFEVVGPNGWPVGWAMVGRPVARVLQEAGFVEVTRVATDGTPNACSALYGAAARWARERELRICTYTLASEPGASLRGAGWVVTREVPAREASGWGASRVRQAHKVEGLPKLRWEPVWSAEQAMKIGGAK